MCGIVGYVGKNNAVDVLISGLKSLEYRGYDSSGIAILDKESIKVIKSEGKIKNLENKLYGGLYSNIGIGHTRWATHGAPTKENAHPHQVGHITLVHNGIIENYIDLKNKLEKDYQFKSETDTEIACALIDKIYKEKKDKLDTLIEASNIIKGSYAFGIIFDDEVDSIYAMRKDSPLIIAPSTTENLIASDVPAILKYTNKYILLDSFEYAIIKNDKITIYDKYKNIINKKINIYNGTCEDVMKNGFDHFMLKEIYDEPKVFENIISSYVNNYNIKTLEQSFGKFAKYNTINIVGCGSAYHTGLVCKSLMEEYANVPVTCELASEYRYKKVFSDKKTLTILISQSGETADTLAALRKAKEKGNDTLGVINVVSSSIARESDKVIYIKAGNEIAVATTKAYLAQVLILALLSILIGYEKEYISEECANKYLLDLKKLIKLTKEQLGKNDIYKDIAKNLYKRKDIFFIGRNIDYALCMEGSLKLKEISYIHSEAYAAGELKHGTISLIEKNTPVIGIVTDRDIAEKTISNIKETKARGSVVTLVTTDKIYKEYKNDNFYDNIILVPNINEFYTPILTIIPLQLLSYYVSLFKGEAIDQPRNLAKSVTVE